MDKPISVGDLVVVVRWAPCGCCLGLIGKVSRILAPRALKLCLQCNHEWPLGTLAPAVVGDYGVPVAWLKRIPPLDELESEKHDEEITA
jgi:hypothetical protein